MPVFGKQTTGASQVQIAPAEHKWAVSYPLSESGIVTKITARMFQDSDPGTVTARWSLYAADGGSGNPGTLLGTTEEHEITSAVVIWDDFPFTIPIQLIAGTYWMSFNSTQTGTRFAVVRYDNVPGSSRDNGDVYAGGDSDPFGVATSDFVEWAVNATYTVAQVDVLSMQAHVFGHNMW